MASAERSNGAAATLAILAVSAVVAAAVLYLWLLYLFFIHVAGWLFGGGCVVIAAGVLLLYLYMVGSTLVWGSGPVEVPLGSEPAYKQYFFHKAFRDARAILGGSFALGAGALGWMGRLGLAMVTDPLKVQERLAGAEESANFGYGALVTWPVGVVVLGLTLTGALTGIAVYLVYGLVHLALVATICALVYATAATFRLLEYFSMLWRRIFIACPSAGCYRRIALPVYRCPGCGATHRRLIPGSYGTFLRRCQCGQRLPTLFLFGRNRLPAFCPHAACGAELNPVLGTVRNLHVPVVGGPSAGKTSFIMANLVDLAARSEAGEVSLTFPEQRHERLFEACRGAFQQGVVVQKTSDFSPDAFLVKLRDRREREALVYMYDPAGELFQGSDEIRNQQYYGYTHGLLFLVDPFSLRQVRADLGSELELSLDRVRPCDERPQDVYDRLVTTLREFSRMGGALRSVPVAVVITKSDACGLSTLLAAVVPPASSPPAMDPESEAIKAWLTRSGEGNLVRCLTQDFKRVRYFECSALGRLPDDSDAPFVPRGIHRPLAWILQENRVTLQSGSPS